MYIPVTSGPDYPVLQRLQQITRRIVVVYGAIQRTVLGVYTSIRKAKKACDTVGAAGSPLCYLMTAAGFWLVADDKGFPVH